MVTRKKSIRRQTLCSKIIHFPFFFFFTSFAFTESYELINISFFTYLVCQRSFLKFSFEILSSTLTHYRSKLVPLRMSYIMSTAVVDDFNLPLTFSTASQTWNWPQTEGLQLLSRIRKKKLSITGKQMHCIFTHVWAIIKMSTDIIQRPQRRKQRAKCYIRKNNCHKYCDRTPLSSQIMLLRKCSFSGAGKCTWTCMYSHL